MNEWYEKRLILFNKMNMLLNFVFMKKDLKKSSFQFYKNWCFNIRFIRVRRKFCKFGKFLYF